MEATNTPVSYDEQPFDYSATTKYADAITKLLLEITERAHTREAMVAVGTVLRTISVNIQNDRVLGQVMDLINDNPVVQVVEQHAGKGHSIKVEFLVPNSAYPECEHCGERHPSAEEMAAQNPNDPLARMMVEIENMLGARRKKDMGPVGNA